MIIHSRYNLPAQTPYHCTGPSRTKQAHKDECDINRIVKRYTAAGINPFQRPVASYNGETVEVSSKTFQEALDVVIKANEAFEGLPSNVRKRFQNNPSELLAFLGDEENYDEGVKLGLFEKRPEPVAAPDPAADS